jgi:uncharacterized membrane protein
MLHLMAHNPSLGNAGRYWRFIVFVILLVIGWVIGIRQLGLERGLLAGFDGAALIFLLLCSQLFSLSPDRLREVAPANDVNRTLRLALSLLVSVVIFATMTALIVDRALLSGADKLLVAATLVLVWTYANMMYTLHYAHLYYQARDDGGDCGGLIFPGGGMPDLSDFAYFAFTIGVAVQTADVAISSARIRRVVTLHSILGFFFNLGVLALTINVLAGA